MGAAVEDVARDIELEVTGGRGAEVVDDGVCNNSAMLTTLELRSVMSRSRFFF